MKIKNSGIKIFLFTLLLVLSSLILYGTNYYVQLMAEHFNNEFESFREKSIRASFTIQNHIDKEVESLFQMRDVYRLKGRNLTRYEFNMIARAIMSRTQGIQALEWIPHVQQKQRVMYGVLSQFDN